MKLHEIITEDRADDAMSRSYGQGGFWRNL